jgi:hypothetical protein
VEAIFREFRTCEMSALAGDGSPITWPTLLFWRPEEGRFLITTPIGLPYRAFNVRRNPRVSLLFSNPPASALKSPRRARAGRRRSPGRGVTASVEGFEDEVREVFRQPASGFYSSNPITR